MSGSNGATPEHQSRVAEVQSDIFRLTQRYTETHRASDVDDALVDRAVAAMRIDVRSASVDEEQEIWRVRSQLAQLAHPSTTSGLRLLSLIQSDDDQPSGARHEARKFQRWGGAFLFWFLVLLAGIHIYLFVMNTASVSADEQAFGFHALEDEIATRSSPSDGRAVSGGTGSDAAGANVAEQPDPSEAYGPPRDAEAISRSLASLCDKMSATALRLSRLSTLGLSMLGEAPATRCPETEGMPAAANATMPGHEARAPASDSALRLQLARVQSSQFAHLEAANNQAKLTRNATRRFLLPILYGALGAYIFALRQIVTLAEQGALSSVARFRYRVRLLLGAIFGLSMSVVLVDDGGQLLFGAGTAGGGLPFVETSAYQSQILMAFLAGYSVEAVFAILDFVISRLRGAVENAFGAQPQEKQSP